MFRTTLYSLTAICLAGVLISCSDDPVAPGIEPEIVNNSESFEFQVTQVSNYTGALNYTWANSQISANLDESSDLNGGSVRLTVVDSEGTTVHSAPLDDGSVATSEGEAGDWTVRVIFEGASGTLNFRLQPRTP